MNGKVKVDVFGISRDPSTGKNSLDIRKYFSLVKFLESSDVISKVDMHFIDTSETAMAKYPAVQKALQSRKPTPIVAINGTVKYFGNIPYESVYQDIKRITAVK